MAKYTLFTRHLIEVNTDPQRRCYNGCHFSSEFRWTAWESLDSGVPEEKRESRLKFWTELNDYAVSQRGEGARRQFEFREEVPSESV